MLNILIQETDLFFQAGLQSFFDDFFKHNFHRSITFHLALTNENVSQADIIVLSLCQGETLTCFPELLARQKGIVIGLVDDELRFSALPSCFQDIIFSRAGRRLTVLAAFCLSRGSGRNYQVTR